MACQSLSADSLCSDDVCFDIKNHHADRLTNACLTSRSGLKEGMVVKIAAAYCIVGYVIIQILYLGVWCRPIQYYWAVPVPHSQRKLNP